MGQPMEVSVQIAAINMIEAVCSFEFFYGRLKLPIRIENERGIFLIPANAMICLHDFVSCLNDEFQIREP